MPYGIDDMHTEILTPAQKSILPGLSRALAGSDYYMAGGTALALQIGHRPSVDFDWFVRKVGDPETLLKKLKQAQLNFIVLSIDLETIYLDINSVQVSFIGYDYPMLLPPLLWKEYDIYLAAIDDIACMKLSAIAGRGSRKDFIDLYIIIKKFKPLKAYLDLFMKKYSQRDIGHIVRSLVFFEDADDEPDVKMNMSINWSEIKREFENWVKKLFSSPF